MKPKPRDPRTWSNVDIEHNPEGYIAAQQGFAEDQEASERLRRDDDDKARFVERFVQEGGRERDAESAFRAHRNERAKEAAATAEAEALHENRRHVSRSL